MSTNQLTEMAGQRLISFLESVGNRLNDPHKMALHALVDAMTRMAEGIITGRLAVGLPTGTGKTSAIVQWCASVHALGLPHSIAVSSSRIDALLDLPPSPPDCWEALACPARFSLRFRSQFLSTARRQRLAWASHIVRNSTMGTLPHR